MPRGAALIPAALILVLLFHPLVQARGKALAVLAEALGAPFPRPFAPAVARAGIVLEGVRGDIYEPRAGAPGIVVLPGAAPEGKDDPRAIRLATALARAGRTVFVPTLRLSDRNFDLADIADIRTSIRALADRTGDKVVVLGISYGGSFALIAAADPATAENITTLALFGAYFDLRGLIQAASTGTSVVGDRRIAWEPDPRAREVLREAAVQLVPEAQQDALRDVLEGRGEAADLPDEAAAVHRLVTNDDPDRTYDLADELGPHGGKLIADFSPSAVADRIEVPVVALHSTDDPVTPYGEAIRLERGLEDVRLVSVSLFQHVDFEGTSLIAALPDLLGAWRFASWVIGAQGG